MENKNMEIKNLDNSIKNRLLYESDVINAIDKYTNDDGTLDGDITCILEEVHDKDTSKKKEQDRIGAQTVLHELKILNLILNQTSSDIDDMIRELECDMDYNDRLNVKSAEKIVNNINGNIDVMSKYIDYLRIDISNM